MIFELRYLAWMYSYDHLIKSNQNFNSIPTQPVTIHFVVTLRLHLFYHRYIIFCTYVLLTILISRYFINCSDVMWNTGYFWGELIIERLNTINC